MRKWLRVLICLLLVFCILVNLSPLRAEATAGTVATAVSLSVAIPVAVAVGLNVLGVRQGSDSTAFNNVVSSAVNALSPEWAVNGLTTMLALTTDGLTKTLAAKSFLQALLDHLIDNDVLISDSMFQCTADMTCSVGSVIVSCSFVGSDHFIFPLKFQGANGSLDELSYIVVGHTINSSPGFSISGASSVSSYYALGYTCSIGDSTYSCSGRWLTGYSGPYFVVPYNASLSDLTPSFYSGAISISDPVFSTPYDLTLESVGHDIDTDYETYVETGIVGIDFGVQFEDDPNTNRNEEDDGKGKWVPVAIPSIYTNPYTDQTQAEAQTGNTPQDVLDSLLQNSGSGDGTGDSTGEGSGTNTGTWKPPSDHNKFALADLSKFFPFCIPFDLYDFFTLLNADPVAPVLSWEIKDLAGQTYSLDVDLSQWDSVALLFRRLQLFLFITGLAAASRKFIKW